ncbi:beta-ketoacyl synthase domain-containing protein, partial [Colletotrichum salicis]
FGFGGTNAHAVLDEPAAYFASRGISANHNSIVDSSQSHDDNEKTEIQVAFSTPQLFVFSSNEHRGVSRLMDTHLDHAEKLADATQRDADNYAYTLGCRRSVMEWKGFAVANSFADLIAKLTARDESGFTRSGRESTLKLGFVFCGQGAQWAQMGRELMCFEVFRQRLDAATQYLKTIGNDFDLAEEIMQPKPESRIQEPQISQPATTAIQLALVDLLRSCNITPSSVVGHSSGEIAAAYACGAVTSEAAWALAYHRGQSAALLRTTSPFLQGAMCAVRLTYSETQAYLESRQNPGDLEIACINSPNSITISGELEDILHMRDELKSRRVLCKVLDVDIAYHSRQMKLVQEDYMERIKSIRPRDTIGDIPFFSSVRGRVYPHTLLQKFYWVENLVSPVQFVSAVKSMMESPNRPDILIELSPHATLASALSEIMAEYSPSNQPTYLSLMQREKDSAATTLQVIGELWARGCPIDMLKVISKGSDNPTYKTLVDLPSYPWNHSKTFWHESHTCTEHRFRSFGRQDLIGSPSPDATTFEPRWRGFFRISENPWIQDHRVQKTIVYPAAGMVTMALEAASQLSHGMTDILGFHLTDLKIERAMIIPSTAYGLEYSLNLKQCSANLEAEPVWEFSIYSKQEDGPWIRHADGCIKIRQKAGGLPSPATGNEAMFKNIQSLCTTTMPPRQLYEILDVVGLNYGPCFQNVASISTHQNSCTSKIRIPDTRSKMPANFEYPHVIHPATLDAMFQTLFAIDTKPMVPSSIESIFVSANTPHGAGFEFTGFATAERHGLRDATGSIVMVADVGDWETPSIVVDGLHFTALSTPSIEDGGFIPNHRNLCSNVVWKEDYTTTMYADLTHMLELMAHKYPSLSVLQCGGDEQMARHILETLSNGARLLLTRFTITDANTLSTMQKIFEKSPAIKVLEYRSWEAVKEHSARYNLIIAVRDSSVDMIQASQLLLQDGLLLNEVSPPMTPTTTDSLSGFQQLSDELASLQVSYEPDLDDAIRCDMLDQHFEVHLFADALDPVSSPEVVLILPDKADAALNSFVTSLKDLLSDKEFKLSTGLLHEVDPAGKICIALLEACESFVYNWTTEQFSDFHNLQNTAKSVLWITRGANRRPTIPQNAPVIALVRTILSEDPQKAIVTLDLAEATHLTSSTLPKAVWSVLASILAGSVEAEFAEEGGDLYIPRLMPQEELNRMIENDSQIEVVQKPIFDQSSSKDSYKMAISRPGVSNDNFHFVKTSYPTKLGPQEVEIQTLSAALHLSDLHTAMGRTDEDFLGIDVMGIVSKVGRDVRDIRCGEQVVALAPDAFKTVHRVDQGFVKPAPLPFECCQYTPSALIAAYYAICGVGKLSKKKKILVHAGASSYGQAAIRIATLIGAEVFATVLGSDSDAQRATLVKAHSIPEDHIFDANGESFVADVLRFGTVNIVYNPTQEHTAISFKCVKPSKSACLSNWCDANII